MLAIQKSASLSGTSMIDGVVAANFYGTVGDNEHMNMNMGDMDTYMANMTEVMKDQQDFMAEYKKLKDIIAPQLQSKGDEMAE